MTQTIQEQTGPVEMSDAEALWYSGNWIDRVPQSVSIIVLGVAMLALWWLIAELEYVSRILLPGPAETFEELWVLNIFTIFPRSKELASVVRGNAKAV